MAHRDEWLAASDAALLGQCDVDTYRASGPGGQKRNKTSSAVRLRHHPSGLAVIAEESRSQHENKARALRRLRQAIALNIRLPLDATCSAPDAAASPMLDSRWDVSRKSPAYLPMLACVLDALSDRSGSVREAAAALGTTTSRLSGFITADPKLLDMANRIRRSRGLKPMRP